MYKCSNCNEVFERNGYCHKCGSLLQNVSNASNMDYNNISPNQRVQEPSFNQGFENTKFANDSSVNQNVANNEKQFDSVTKKDDKKYAIISIAIGAGGLIFYSFIGLSVWIALVLCSLGINLANKSKQSAPGLSKAGIVLNVLLGITAIIMWILLVIISLA